ncbi:hypothetical protein B0A49_08062 [Cryomyces minteri]|uniref:Ketoreductase domain-containing protein n=1 Tax=Cryomyces minteri TaxID=331657 RepID=A0A4U0WXW6_9PEZI|nr:hypothetical protein B0A49_08062 [Cryomyces minteri]
MSYRFDSKAVLITGGASGIGRATAQKLSSLGANLALCDISAKGLEETNKLCGGGHLTSIVDVGSTEEVNKFVGDVVAHFGKLDHVFNCAGVNPTSYDLETSSDEYWDKLVNTNLKGTFNVTRASIPHLKSGCSFVNVSSILGLQATAKMAIYCMTKSGIIGFSKSMALELGPRGIRTNIICPGYINTPTNSGVVEGAEGIKKMEQATAVGRLGQPEEIADVVAFLFSEESRYMNGSVVEIDGGIA